MYDGGVSVNGELVRNSTPDWGGLATRMAATRMVSVVLRGRAYDLAALPATADIAHVRFGVALGRGNSMRVTGMSSGAPHVHPVPHVQFVWCRMCVYACVVSTLIFTRRVRFRVRATQRTTSCRTCDSSCAPA